MGYFLRQDKKKKGIYLQMYETYWDTRIKQARTRCIKSFGYINELVSEDIPDPVAHFKQYVREEELKRRKAQDDNTKPRAFEDNVEKNVGYFVGHAISRCNNNSLVFTTFDRAIAANPEAKPLLHSDRGFQYTSKVYQCKLSEQGMTQSMSRVGHCIDNGPTEGFWGIVKAEMYNLKKFSSEEELRTAIEEFIRYYNEGRYRARFGFKSPLEVRTAALASTKPEQYPIPENPRIQKYKARYAV